MIMDFKGIYPKVDSAAFIAENAMVIGDDDIDLICKGFFFGGLLGAKLATKLSNIVLERIFGVALHLILLKMIFTR